MKFLFILFCGLYGFSMQCSTPSDYRYFIWEHWKYICIYRKLGLETCFCVPACLCPSEQMCLVTEYSHCSRNSDKLQLQYLQLSVNCFRGFFFFHWRIDIKRWTSPRTVFPTFRYYSKMDCFLDLVLEHFYTLFLYLLHVGLNLCYCMQPSMK